MFLGGPRSLVGAFFARTAFEGTPVRAVGSTWASAGVTIRASATEGSLSAAGYAAAGCHPRMSRSRYGLRVLHQRLVTMARTQQVTGWRRAALPVGVWALFGILAAQEPAEMTTSEKPAVFRSNTSLVLVPVVVRDSRGQVVTTLRKEDFRLTDGGKAQPISRFSVERRAASARGRFYGPRAAMRPHTLSPTGIGT